MTSEIHVSDLSRCEPACALSVTARPGAWRVVPYETEEGVRGNMIFAAPEDRAPPVTIRLGARGPHRIFVGINHTRSSLGDTLHHTPWSMYGSTWLKLTGDVGCSRFAPEMLWRHALGRFPDRVGREGEIWGAVHETYWRTADVSGRDLVIRPPGPPCDGPEVAGIANLAWVRLVPLAAAEVASWRALAPGPDTRRLAILYCTGQLTGHTSGSPMFHPTDEQWMCEELAPFLDNDVGIISFEAIRGNLCAFHTRTGDVGTEDNRWPADWIDPLATAVALARRHGIAVFASMRMIGASLPVVRQPIQWARFYWRHQAWAKRSPEGIAASGLSLAYPEVRAHWISLLRETLALGCDGVQLHLNRSDPFVLYERPSAEAFHRDHGVDLRDVSLADPRWAGHMDRFVTRFLREVRAMLAEWPGRKLAVTVPCGSYGSAAAIDPMRRGCDVETWLAEGLVDYLMPTPAIDPGRLARWRSLASRRVQIWPDLMPRTQPGEAYAALARSYYEAGADGLCLWDGERRAPRCSEWSVLRHLGHRDQLDRLASEAPAYFRRVPLHTLNGLAVRYSFADG